MSQRAWVLLAPGFEEIEAVTVVDVLRRAEVATFLMALDGREVTGAHGITLVADGSVDAIELRSRDALVLPGGMPGAQHLKDDRQVKALLAEAQRLGVLVGAICAAPIALEAAGLLKGIPATAYPGFPLPSAEFTEARVVRSGRVVTSRGPGTALEFALALVAELCGEPRRDNLSEQMLAAG